MYDKNLIQRLKQIPIRDILKQAGCDVTCHRKGTCTFFSSPFRAENNPSLCVFSDNSWKDFGDAAGKLSGDAINLVEDLYHETFNQATSRLRAMISIGTAVKEVSDDAQSKKSNGKILEIHRTIQSPGLIQYISSRRIPIVVFNTMAMELVYECYGHTHVAAAIPVDTGGYSIRGLPSANDVGIKRFIGGGSGISTLYSGTGNPQKECLVFEGMFNAMSYVTMFGFPPADIIILNGVGNSKILEGAGLRGIRSLYCFLDADRAGQEAAESIRRLAGCTVYDRSDLYESKGYNDLNDMLIGTPM